MSETTEKKVTEPKAPIDFSSIGGKCVLEASEPVKTEKPIDFSSIGGKCVLRSPLCAETKPAESKDDDNA